MSILSSTIQKEYQSIVFRFHTEVRRFLNRYVFTLNILCNKGTIIFKVILDVGTADVVAREMDKAIGNEEEDLQWIESQEQLHELRLDQGMDGLSGIPIRQLFVTGICTPI
jgi:hypothetical protein